MCRYPKPFFLSLRAISRHFVSLSKRLYDGMENKIMSFWTYIKARWFQVCLLALCLFLVFKKEIKFNFEGLNSKA